MWDTTLYVLICLLWVSIFIRFTVFKPEYLKEEPIPPRKPFCRFPREHRENPNSCIKPLLRKDGKLDSDPEVAAAQSRWILYKQQEDAMNAWESEFWGGDSLTKVVDALEYSVKNMVAFEDNRDQAGKPKSSQCRG